MIASTAGILAVLGFCVAASEWLARRTPLRLFGSALVVIVLGAIAANAGLIPTVGDGSPVYDAIFAYIAPLAIFLLLLRVQLRAVLRAGGPMLALFLLGSAGTMLGVVVGMRVVGGGSVFGEMSHALCGMFVGTYTGGSINFNAVALEYGVVRDGNLYAGAAVVDSAMTTVWMAATVILPRMLGTSIAGASAAGDRTDDESHDVERVEPANLALVVSIGLAVVLVAGPIADACAAALGFRPPPVVVVTTIALTLAQLVPVQALRGARIGGMLAVMLFLAVIGALCDFAALSDMGSLGVSLSVFVGITVVVHGIVVFGAAKLMGMDPAVAAVASQANIGGGTTALALARSLGRPDLVLPGILVGSLGTALGTYLGFMTAAWLS